MNEIIEWCIANEIIEWGLVIAPPLIGIGCLIIGIIIGKRSRDITLEGQGAKEAFAYFLSRERYRHQEDIYRISTDLAKLKKQGVRVPDIPVDLWIEVK